MYNIFIIILGGIVLENKRDLWFDNIKWFTAIRNKKIIKPFGVAVLALWIAAFIIFNDKIFYRIFPLAMPYSVYPKPYDGMYPVVGRAVFLALSLLVSLAFMSLVPKCKTLITHIGQNSMYVYVLHGIFVIYLRTINKYNYPIFKKINSISEYIVFVVICVVLTFVLSSKFTKKIFKPILEPDIDLSRFFKK